MSRLKDWGCMNDMPKGWLKDSLNMKIYELWRSMLCRCNLEPSDRAYPYYKDSKYHDDFKYLSNFVKWIEFQPRYKEFCDTYTEIKWSIDKDIKCNGNKNYYPEYMILVPFKENNQYRLDVHGNPMCNEKVWKENGLRCRKPCIGIPLDSNEPILVFSYRQYVKQFGFNSGHVGECCNKKRNTHHNYKWYWLQIIEL